MTPRKAAHQIRDFFIMTAIVAFLLIGQILGFDEQELGEECE